MREIMLEGFILCVWLTSQISANRLVSCSARPNLISTFSFTSIFFLSISSSLAWNVAKVDLVESSSLMSSTDSFLPCPAFPKALWFIIFCVSWLEKISQKKISQFFQFAILFFISSSPLLLLQNSLSQQLAYSLQYLSKSKRSKTLNIAKQRQWDKTTLLIVPLNLQFTMLPWKLSFMWTNLLLWHKSLLEIFLMQVCP